MLTNQSDLELEFNIGHCNGTMSMEIFANDTLVSSYSLFDTDRFVFKHCIDWPTTLKIVLSNKNLLHDTTVNSDGKIIADKYIQLIRIVVDRIEASVEHMNSIVLNTDDNKITATYWGFNGYVELNLTQENSFMWHLAQRIDHSASYIVHGTKF
jgi:hypothetical protein